MTRPKQLVSLLRIALVSPDCACAAGEKQRDLPELEEPEKDGKDVQQQEDQRSPGMLTES
jgi:hypothetical protein